MLLQLDNIHLNFEYSKSKKEDNTQQSPNQIHKELILYLAN